MRISQTKEPLWYGRNRTMVDWMPFVAAHHVRGFNPIAPHRLNLHEVAVVETGQLDLTLDGRRVAVSAGHLTVIPPRTEIRSEEGPNTGQYFWIGLRPARFTPGSLPASVRDEVMAFFATLEGGLPEARPAPGGLVPAVHDLVEVLQDGASSGLDRLARVLGFVAPLDRALSERSGAASRRVPPPIRTALDLIHSSSGADLHVADLPARCGLSRTTFNAWFREATGETPLAYLNQHRIHRAREWLADPEMPVTDIAARLGFSSSQYFASVFRRLTGLSPSAYRARVAAGAGSGP